MILVIGTNSRKIGNHLDVEGFKQRSGSYTALLKDSWGLHSASSKQDLSVGFDKGCFSGISGDNVDANRLLVFELHLGSVVLDE